MGITVGNATLASHLGTVTARMQACNHAVQGTAFKVWGGVEPSILDGAAGEENMGDKRPFWMARLTKEEEWKMNGEMGTSPLWVALAKGRVQHHNRWATLSDIQTGTVIAQRILQVRDSEPDQHNSSPPNVWAV
jgi:hypothetical protein